MQLAKVSFALALFPGHHDSAGRARVADFFQNLDLSIRANSTRLAYKQAYNAFAQWWATESPYEPLSRNLLLRYSAAMQVKNGRYKVAPATHNQRLAALRHFAREAAYSKLIPRTLYEDITSVPATPIAGEKNGIWLSQEETLALLQHVDRSTLKGLRDYTMLLVLFGCGLRRAELASLSVEHLGERDGRPAIIALAGKGGRTRHLALPNAVDQALQLWLHQSAISSGAVFRAVHRTSTVWGDGLSAEAVRRVVMHYASLFSNRTQNPHLKSKLKKFRPHDARRTFAKSCREQKGSLEEIQQMLGHQSITTTMIYLGHDRNLKHSINDQLTYLQQI